jgi:hypothetical protein
MLHFLVVLHQLWYALYPKHNIQVQNYEKKLRPCNTSYAERNKKYTIDLKDVDLIVSIIPPTLQLGKDAIGFVRGKRISTRSRSL